MSGRGKAQGSFRNQRGFQSVRGSSSPSSATLKKSRVSIRNETYSVGGPPSTRSATSPSIRTRSVTPSSDSNVPRSPNKVRNSVVGGGANAGGRIPQGRSGKNNESKSSSSTLLSYKQLSIPSFSTRSDSPELRKKNMETANSKKRGLAEKRFAGKPKFQDNPSAPEIVDCNQPGRDNNEVDLKDSYEGSSDTFMSM